MSMTALYLIRSNQTPDEDAQMLLKLRWYLLDSTIGDILDIVDEEDPDRRKLINSQAEDDGTLSMDMSVVHARDISNKFLAILIQIGKVIKWYCKIVKLVVQTQLASAFRLTIYCHLFKRFTTACVSYSKNYEFLEDSINKVFKENFPTYPQFPQFSFWHMFIRIWAADVYQPLCEDLHKECLNNLLRIRKTSAEKTLTSITNPPLTEKYVTVEPGQPISSQPRLNWM